jgi:RNA recognition motif-containing protein
MEKAEDAEKAIKDLDGKESGGRKVVVNFAKPKEDKPRTGGRPDRGDRRPSFRR